MKILVALVLSMAVSACGSLLPKTAPPPAFYTLDASVRSAEGGTTASASAGTSVGATVAMATSAPTLIVNPPQAAAGYDSARIIYVRQPQQLQYFAQSEWADTPARMLAPLLVTTLHNGGAFKAVVGSPSAAIGDLRLDTEIVRLQQNFDGTGSSAVRFTLRAALVDNATRKVRGTREFDASVAAGSDAYSGVLAANAAVQQVLQQLARFAAESAR